MKNGNHSNSNSLFAIWKLKKKPIIIQEIFNGRTFHQVVHESFDFTAICECSIPSAQDPERHTQICRVQVRMVRW